jgi:hypothetical protein
MKHHEFKCLVLILNISFCFFPISGFCGELTVRNAEKNQILTEIKTLTDFWKTYAFTKLLDSDWESLQQRIKETNFDTNIDKDKELRIFWQSFVDFLVGTSYYELKLYRKSMKYLEQIKKEAGLIYLAGLLWKYPIAKKLELNSADISNEIAKYSEKEIKDLFVKAYEYNLDAWAIKEIWEEKINEHKNKDLYPNIDIQEDCLPTYNPAYCNENMADHKVIIEPYQPFYRVVITNFETYPAACLFAKQIANFICKENNFWIRKDTYSCRYVIQTGSFIKCENAIGEKKNIESIISYITNN